MELFNQEYRHFSIGKLAEVIGAKLPDTIDKNIECKRILTQSNYVQPGEIVISAGWYSHKRITTEALEKGAMLVFVNAETKESFPQDNVIAVEDPMECVKMFERWRSEACNAKIIAITGSVGKTTTTGLIGMVMKHSFNTLTHHSMANSHGAILRTYQTLTPEHEYWVQEVGGVQPGYIESSASVLCPDIAVLTNIGESHLDKYITKEGILRDKGSIERYLKDDGIVIINSDDETLKNASFTHKVITLSLKDENADYYVTDIKTLPEGITFSFTCGEGSFEAKLKLYGDYNAYNGLAAIAVGRLAGVPMERIIELIGKYEADGMRQNFRNIGGHKLLIDCFNAEPKTVLGSAETLMKMPVENGGRRIFVTGHIDKLGENSRALHTELGRELAKLDLDIVLLYGGDSDCIHEALMAEGRQNSMLMNTREELDCWLEKNITEKDITFYKSGQFETALAKTIDHVYGTKLQNEQQYNNGYLVEKNGFKIRIRKDNIAEVVGYSGNERDLVIPSEYEGIPIIRIQNRAFLKKRNLETIVIPDSVTYIGEEAFYICPSLRFVKLPKNLKYVDKNAFNYCKSLTSISLPDGVRHLDRHAFYDCTALEKIYIPDSVGFFGEDVLKKSPNAKIVCSNDSAAKKYATLHDILTISTENQDSNKKGLSDADFEQYLNCLVTHRFDDTVKALVEIIEKDTKKEKDSKVLKLFKKYLSK